MKLNKNLFLALLTSLTLFGCGGSSNPTVTGTIPEMSEHPVDPSKVLHKVNVRASATPFVVDGETEWKIMYVTGDNWLLRSTDFIVTHVKKHLGVTLEKVVYDPSAYTYNAEDKYIFVGVDSVWNEAGVPTSTDDIGAGGYQLTSHDNSVFIRCNTGYGYVHAARTFLQHTIGYERFAENVTIYTKDGTTMPIFDAVERPDITYRMPSYATESQTAYEMGFLSFGEAFHAGDGIQHFHNSFDYLKPDDYLESHPKWYSPAVGQICYTARGDAEEYQALIETAAAGLLKSIRKNTTTNSFTFTIQDNHDFCTCDNCNELARLYQTESGVVITFMNDVDDIIQAELQKDAEASGTKKREVNLNFFAYHRTLYPGVHKDESGKWVPNHEDLICNPSVIPYIAPIEANFTYSFYEDINSSTREVIEGWQALSNRIFLWFYQTNFSNYMYPFNSYQTMLETYRYAISQGADFMFCQGQHNQRAPTAFGRFKEYLNHISQYNSSIEYEWIVNNFFDNYFLDASPIMKEFFYELQGYLWTLLDTYPTDLVGNIYEGINDIKFWPKKLLERYLSYIDQAYAAVEHLRTEDPVQYQNVRDNILLESIFPRFAILEHHRGKFTTSELNAMINEFERDCANLRVTNSAEQIALSSVIASWRPN